MKLAPLALTLLVGLLVGCDTPCKVISNANWICNIEVVESVKPGDFLLSTPKGVQLLPAKPIPGLSVGSRPTNIANMTNNTDWTFDLSAGLNVPKGLPEAKGKLEAAGATKYTVTFSQSTTEYLQSNGGSTDPIESLAEAKERAERYLEVLAPADKTKLNNEAKKGNVKILLITQTLNTAVDYKFEGSQKWSTAVTVPLEEVTVGVGGTVVDSQTRTVKFTEPLSIAYRALTLAVTPSDLQSAPQIKVSGSSYGKP